MSENTSTVERGKRVKRCRNIANLSREEMCDERGLNLNTLKGWELGKHGGLSEKGAKKIVARIARAGVKCSVSWLLTGFGEPPMLLHDLVMPEEKPNIAHAEETQIKNELAYFLGSLDKDHASTLKIMDEGMLPFYTPGDYVAGTKRYDEEIMTCLGLIGIAELSNGRCLLRKLRKNPTENRYNLIAINDDYQGHDALLVDIALISFTPILWHRQPRRISIRSMMPAMPKIEEKHREKEALPA